MTIPTELSIAILNELAAASRLIASIPPEVLAKHVTPELFEDAVRTKNRTEQIRERLLAAEHAKEAAET